MDTTETLRRIEQISAAVEGHGYFVTADPIPGQEDLFLAHLREGLVKIEETVAFIHRRYRTRDLSRRTLDLLHSALPSPVWAIELA